MAIESFLVTALPHSADPAAPFHLSLFVTHRLTPDGAQGVLADFPHVADWAGALAGATITVSGRTGGGATVPVPVTALLSAPDPTLWPRVFPADLVVRPWRTPEPTSVPWRTFPAHRMQRHALLTHAVAMFSSPLDPPSVAGNALTAPLLSALGLGQFGRRLTLDQLFPDAPAQEVPPLDHRATAFLDDISGGGAPGVGLGTASFSSAVPPLSLLTADAHRALRYYQRAEDQQPYRATPVDGAAPAPLVRPTPDFHERVSLLGDLPPLLRRLGLVIDLVVDDLAVLQTVTAIRARVDIPGLVNPVRRQPAVACAVRGLAFFAESATDDYAWGMLRVGDEATFTVLDLDPDASALALERYLRTVPRLLAAEANGDPVTSVPGALRATGFALARVDRAQQLQQRLSGTSARDAALLAGKAAPLHLEDVTRGVRLEVWDDVSGRWHSLHRRRVDVQVDGAGPVLDDEPDVGFLQGATLSRTDGVAPDDPSAPTYAHEVVAGWDGWSLSAPRPGLTVIHENGEERIVEAPDPGPDPANPVVTRTRVEPLTLPWLRYGRRYSLRAWAVDLAGNSARHAVAGPPTPDAAAGRRSRHGDPATPLPPEVERVLGKVVASRLSDLGPDALAGTASGPVAELGRADLAVVREEMERSRPPRRVGPARDRAVRGLDPDRLHPTGTPEVDRLVVARLGDRVARSAAAAPSRRERVAEAFVSARAEHLLERTDLAEPTVLEQAWRTALLARPEAVRGSVLAELLSVLSSVVTLPRPFLRWDPVLEPAVVPRHSYSEAESLLTLVVRSGVEGPGSDPLETTLVDPATFLATTTAARPELELQWRATSERHLAPPKVGQLTAELHGRLDAAFGGGSPADVRAALAVALREAGTFLDTTVADLDNPGARLAQPGVSLHTTPTAQTPTVTDPGDLERGDPLTTGQYVVHDVDTLVVPYLPDPLATGLSFVFPDAGADHRLVGLAAVEGTRLDYAGDWPEPVPWRMVLEAGSELSAHAEDGVVSFRLPPGEQLRVRLSSALDRAGLDLLGLWRSLPASLRALDVVAEAAADGWLWWLTPATTLRLVHATPKPVQVPRVTVLLPVRVPGDTAVGLVGGVDVHGPSTERLDVEASWSECVDDVAKPAPERVQVVGTAGGTQVRPDEDLVVLTPADGAVPLPDGSALHLHATVHQLGDTRHRLVDYRVRATTRYREYFDPRLLPHVDDISLVGPAVQVDVPSSARPTKPVVADVLPLFRWSEQTEPEQPFALRRTRGCGLRLYLERPWYSSGDGELLGVVVALGNDALVADLVSQWAADPVFDAQAPASRSVLPLTDLIHLAGIDDRVEPGRPVGPPVVRPLVDAPGGPAAWVLGYQPEYAPDRGLWFVDVAFDPGATFWPFVRLAVVRYQPSSLPGLHLSPVVRCDFAQLPPPRIATVTRPDERHARVLVTGPVGVPAGLRGPEGSGFLGRLTASRTVRARLERRVPALPTDLGWQTVATGDLQLAGLDGTIASWAGSLPLPQPIDPTRPGADPDWRVTVEEWERLPSDRPRTQRLPRVEHRLVYADHLPL